MSEDLVLKTIERRFSELSEQISRLATGMDTLSNRVSVLENSSSTSSPLRVANMQEFVVDQANFSNWKEFSRFQDLILSDPEAGRAWREIIRRMPLSLGNEVVFLNTKIKDSLDLVCDHGGRLDESFYVNFLASKKYLDGFKGTGGKGKNKFNKERFLKAEQ